MIKELPSRDPREGNDMLILDYHQGKHAVKKLEW